MDNKIKTAKKWIDKGYTKIYIQSGVYLLSNGEKTVQIDEEIYDYLTKEEL